MQEEMRKIKAIKEKLTDVKDKCIIGILETENKHLEQENIVKHYSIKCPRNEKGNTEG